MNTHSPSSMQSYYGGEARCAQAAAVSDDYDPTELVCPACSNVSGTAVQVRAHHGSPSMKHVNLITTTKDPLNKGHLIVRHWV